MYRLLNVTLRLRNIGDTTDVLNVTIRADAGGVPSSSYLAASTIVIGNNNLGTYSVRFMSPPSLVGGTRYWIVATCASALVNAYQWYHSAADTFAGVANGPRTFDITARIAIGTEPGTMVTKGIALAYLNATSVPKTAPGSRASVLVGKQTKQVYLSPIAVGSAERLSPPRPTGDATDQYNETLTKDASAHH